MLADEAAEGLQGVGGRWGPIVDLSDDHRAARQPGRLTGHVRHGWRQQPHGDEETDHARRRPSRPVERPSRHRHGQAGAGSDDEADGLPEEGAAEQGPDGEQQPRGRRGLFEALDDRGHHPCGQHEPEHHARPRQGASQQAEPVPTDRRRDGEHDQHEVERVHVRSRAAFSPPGTGPRSRAVVRKPVWATIR